ncbi:MAG: glycosyltransferase [Clostridia bacterium]|nr:glycosyltransferase [Clostridia bacterium]
MKILQINSTYKQKSTGRTCFEVEKALKKAGDECVTACQFGFEKNNPNVYRINTWLEYYLHNIFGRITGLCGYGSVFATKRLVRYIKKYQPDLIHLRNLHAFYINIPILFGFLREYGRPVVQSLHDFWIFTGKCPYYTANNCEKWKTMCGGCPKNVVHQYPQSLFFDFSKKMYKDKKRWLTAIPKLKVLGVSKWTAEQAKMSFLKDRDIDYIYNWIDLETFKPGDRNILGEYGLDSTKFTVICAGVCWAKNSTKYADLMELIELCKEDDIQFAVIGECENESTEKVKFLGYIKDIKLLSKLYSSSDSYVHLSQEDTFGKVIAEALACGTPAVVYDVTAIPELVDEGCGFAVPPRDIKAARDAIRAIKEKGKNFYRDNCRKRVEKLFEYDSNVGKLLSVYKEEIER